MAPAEFWDRTQLYEQVWKQPMSKLARTYGISDVALAKVCRRLKIPLPGRGYWAKPVYRRPKRPPLPAVPDMPRISRPIRRKLNSENAVPAVVPMSDAKQAELALIQRLEKFEIGSLDPLASEPDALVKRTCRALARGSTDGRKVLCPRAGDTCVDVRVSKQSLDRALGILDRLLAILRAEGLSVTVASNGRESTRVQILNQEVRFGLLERVRQFRPDTETKSTNRFTSIFDRPPMEYEPTGELCFQIWNSCQNVRRGWHDTKHQTLEQMVYKFVAGMVRVAQRERHEAEQRRIDAERHRQEEVFRRKHLEELALLKGQIEGEELRVRRLEEAASNWIRAKHIRDYVIALIEYKTKQGHKLVPKSALAKWALWAMEQADRLDPLAESPSSVLDRRRELSGERR